MKKNYFLLLLIVLFALVACDYNESSVVVDIIEKQQDAIIDGKIPLNRAISNADFVFNNTEALGHKNRKIKSVDVLSKSNSKIVNTRSSAQNEQDAPLAYVVNYENNEGFAILAADTKLPPIISIGDEGNFNTEGFVDFIQDNGATRSNEDINPAQEVQYAIVNNSLLLPPADIGNNFSNCTDTTILVKCAPLVRTKWDQISPYNYYAPMDPNNSNLKSYAGCGPVAAAQILAALCFHHNWRPTTQLSNEYPINWYLINKIIFDDVKYFYSNDTSSNALAVASLIRALGEASEANYSYTDGTWVYTSKMNDAYTRLGLTNVHHILGNSDTTRDAIFNMILNKNYPITVRADNRLNTKGAHFFILDGWLRLEYSWITAELTDTIIGNPTLLTDNIQRNFDLVHINLGWGGYCDGYYLLDAFDLSESSYKEYAEEGDYGTADGYVYDLNVGYTIYDDIQ